MAYLNKVFLMGNLTRDPELSYTPSGVPICKFGMAVNRKYTTKQGEQKEEVLFIDINVWKKQAENCAQYLKKGSQALIEGSLQLDSWQSKTGEKRSKIKVQAQTVKFMGGGSGARSETGAGPAKEPEPVDSEPISNVDVPEGPEEEVPF
ncbi:MAG: single-stranded DNA-binding protein [Candidatus Brocadiia bacterium]